MNQPTSMHQRFRAVQSLETGTSAVPATNPSIDQALIDLILAPLGRDESSSNGHARKEREIGRLFGSLSVMEAWTLHRRLANPQSDDAAATAFGRMIVERRNRLLAFLGDPRRRAALG